MHTWKTRIAATLAVLMLTNCISPAAFAQNTEESPQSTQVSLLSDENNADFTIEDGVLTAYIMRLRCTALPALLQKNMWQRSGRIRATAAN